MIFAPTHVLGIALSDRAISIAQVGGGSGGRVVQRTGSFAIPVDLSFEKPAELGAALSSFLRHEGFAGNRAVIGVPARWVIAVEKDVPPAGREQFKALLRLQAERLPLADNGELVFDYVGAHDYSKPGRVLLVAMLKKQMDKVMQTMEAAGLSIAAVTPTALALATTSADSAKATANSPLVMLARHGAEVVWQREGSPRMLRHFSVSVSNGHDAPAIGSLGTELRRAVALGGGVVGGNGDRELVLWDAVGLEDAQVNELADKVGVKVRSGDNLQMLGARAETLLSPRDERSPQRFAGAVALSIAGAQRQLMPLDFVRSRLAPPRQRKIGRKAVMAGAVAALLVIVIAGLYIDVNLKERDLNTITEQRAAIRPQAQASQAIKDKIDFTNLYLTQRGPALQCLADVAGVFRFGEDIWVTEYEVKEKADSKELGRVEGTLTGKTSDYNLARTIEARLRANSKFSGVVTTLASASGARGREQLSNYTIKFSYNANDNPPAQPVAASARGTGR